jgi:DnaJ-class molecular chaperone
MTNHYQTLGVDKGADPATIKKAFRRKAREHHPDKHGGDPAAEEKFKEVAQAYRILSNPLLKDHYDEFGEAGAERSAEGEAVKALVLLLMQAVDNCDVKHTDICSETRRVIEFKQGEMRSAIKRVKQQIKRWQEAQSRLRSKSPDDFMAAAFSTQLNNLDGAVKTQEFQLEVSKAMLKLLDGYEYRTDKDDRRAMFSNFEFSVTMMPR